MNRATHSQLISVLNGDSLRVIGVSACGRPQLRDQRAHCRIGSRGVAGRDRLDCRPESSGEGGPAGTPRRGVLAVRRVTADGLHTARIAQALEQRLAYLQAQEQPAKAAGF